METISLTIGSVVSLDGARVDDHRRPVEFVGELFAHRTSYGYDYRSGTPTSTRGRTETLYKTQDGRLVVHIKNWSRWQGEPITSHLRQVTETDLQPGGEFEALGREAGFGRPLTLDEALWRGPRQGDAGV